MIPTRLWQAAFVVCVLAVTWLSLTPQAQLPAINIWDKLSHVIAYLTLGLLLHFGWPAKGWVRSKFFPLFLYGALIELAQSFISGRQGSLADLAANTLGLMTAAIVAYATSRQRRNTVSS